MTRDRLGWLVTQQKRKDKTSAPAGVFLLALWYYILTAAAKLNSEVLRTVLAETLSVREVISLLKPVSRRRPDRENEIGAWASFA